MSASVIAVAMRNGLTGKAALSRRSRPFVYGDHGFFALFGERADLNSANLDVEQGVGRIGLGNDDLSRGELNRFVPP